jgi:hypothetical protein
LQDSMSDNLHACERCGDEKPKADMHETEGFHPVCNQCHQQYLDEGYGEPDGPRDGESFGRWSNRVFGRGP